MFIIDQSFQEITMKFKLLSCIFVCLFFSILSNKSYAIETADESKKEYEFVGRHFVASYYGCDVVALSNFRELKEIIKKASMAAGAQVLGESDYVFPPSGYTMVALLSESHASIHTYPEKQSCFVDLFTCGVNCSAEKFDEVLRDYLKPTSSSREFLVRK